MIHIMYLYVFVCIYIYIHMQKNAMQWHHVLKDIMRKRQIYSSFRFIGSAVHALVILPMTYIYSHMYTFTCVYIHVWYQCYTYTYLFIECPYIHFYIFAICTTYMIKKMRKNFYFKCINVLHILVICFFSLYNTYLK